MTINNRINQGDISVFAEGTQERGGVNINPSASFIKRPPPPAASKPTGTGATETMPSVDASATDIAATNASNSIKTNS